MLNATASSQASKHHRVSRSNSVSSSSVVTVQRAASLTGSRPSNLALRSQSPNEANKGGAKLAEGALSIDSIHGTSAGHSRPNSITGIKEGVGNLNRWSQSTTSSKSSAGHNRRSSLSRRLSFGGSGSISSFTGLTASQSPKSRKVFTKQQISPGNSPKRQTLKTPPGVASSTALPPFITLPPLTIITNDEDSPSTAASVTPATADLLTTPTDYFGNKWNGPSPPRRRPGVHRTITAPSPLVAPSSSSRKDLSAGFDTHHASASSDSALSQPNNAPTRAKYKDRDRTHHVGHSRNRVDRGKGSGSTGAESSASSSRSTREGKRRHKVPSQKAMLSKALQKAHTAVLLDNAQNYEGAMDAYRDACALLRQVMVKSSGEDDRRKLEAIRRTYTNRIDELMTMDLSYRQTGGKALPKRPKSNESKDQELSSYIDDDEQHAATLQTAMITRIVNDDPYNKQQREPRTRSGTESSRVRRSLLPSPLDETVQIIPGWQSSQHSQQRNRPRSPVREKIKTTAMTLALPMETDCLPPPLSPRRPITPNPPDPQPARGPSSAPLLKSTEQIQANRHSRDNSNGSTSWLDTIDESDGSSASSVHSRSSSIGLRRKRIRAASGATEADFDAALDAAVEAAYDDGFEPVDEGNGQSVEQRVASNVISNARRNVEMAKQRVREAESEAAMVLSRDQHNKATHKRTTARNRSYSIELDYGDDEAEEEERMLEEMTKGYVMDDFEFDMQSKSALPRQSDSSGFSGRTWGSSIGSNPTSAGTSLSTVAEALVLPSLATQLQSQLPPPPAHPPPSSALPAPPVAMPTVSPLPLPTSAPSRPVSSGMSQSQGVRDRRLSGQNAKQLKIETNTELSGGSQGLRTQASLAPPSTMSAQTIDESPNTASTVSHSQSTFGGMSFQAPASATNQAISRQISSPFSESSPADTVPSESPVTPALTKVTSYESDESVPPVPSSPARLLRKVATGPGNLRKNFSSSSLKNRSLSVSTPDISDISPSTPLSSTFAVTGQQRKGPTTTIPALPTPTGGTFTLNGLPTGGVYLFDSDIHSPTSPGSPNPTAVNPPLPLEPCPESSLLRPFWLLRCLYQTLAHPRGGYLSTKLFVPRDVWRVRNVKIKGLEEKVANCDLLTAALLKLSRVNTLDADAVLEEMQSLESVLDQVQVSLSKKLGNEVGVQVSSSLFKGGTTAEEAGSHMDNLPSKSSNLAGKSYLTTWRKLRSKNSAAVPTTAILPLSSKDGVRETMSMSSLPMTNLHNIRPAKRDVSQVQCTGPNANYMGALARLFDAVQVLDQIARQVEDPGLKHSSQTHVGLELSTRHAAEFFAFYVCRFALTDVGMMLDKFIKRGSEWVLA
ncbi:hypothetical protein MMC16_007117 [Acarospora aff. strigata]|nr:hypothetical protein [Acarospora aff. strigata]